jgi:hypothetical protein
MDIRTLKVGQEVRLIIGPYGRKAKVVEVTPSGVIVQNAIFEGPVTPEGPERMRFDTNGKACDSRDIYTGFMDCNGIPGKWWEGNIFEPFELAVEYEKE